MKALLTAAAAVILAVIFRRPLKSLGRLAARSGLWLGALWLLRGVGPLIGVHLGVNLCNAVVLGVLGLPGLALLMLVQWVI